MGERVRLRILATVLAVSVPVTLAGCSTDRSASTTASAAGDHAATTLPAPVLKISPATSATRLPISTEIGTAVANGTVSSVTVQSAAGRAVSGTMRPDGTAWVPATPLQYGEHYTAQVVATGPDGQTRTGTTSFSTAPAPTTRPISTSINLVDHAVYGVGMPIVIDFGAPIPTSQQAAVQRRLFVTSAPAQLGAWRWYSDREVMYRPLSYWKPGTTLTVRSALDGVPIGTRVLDKDRTATATIGSDLEFAVTDSDHMLTITSGGKVVHRYPISMGKPSTPSWSGHFVIMERDYYTVFDTLGQPGGYRIPVNYAERLTWSGTFIHSAPWSVYAQGNRNVSHGCVNVGPSNAAWIFKNSKIGDPVSITGTPLHVKAGNGWTVWDMSWSDYIKGSAIPVTLSLPDAF